MIWTSLIWHSGLFQARANIANRKDIFHVKSGQKWLKNNDNNKQYIIPLRMEQMSEAKFA